MVLSNVDIAEALRQNRFIIDPSPGPQDFATSSVDLHLSDEFLGWDQDEAQKTAEAMGYSEFSIDVSGFNFRSLASRFLRTIEPNSDGSIILVPHQFLLSTTLETVGNSNPACCLAARVEGRSSLARLGLQIHMTAPTIHAGFFGKIALEIFNAGPFPLKLKKGLAICQLIIEEIKTPPSGSMEGHAFQRQESARGTCG